MWPWGRETIAAASFQGEGTDYGDTKRPANLLRSANRRSLLYEGRRGKGEGAFDLLPSIFCLRMVDGAGMGYPRHDRRIGRGGIGMLRRVQSHFAEHHHHTLILAVVATLLA